MKEQLIDFLKYIYDECTDSYGNLEIVEFGDELDPTFDKVVSEYLNRNKSINEIRTI